MEVVLVYVGVGLFALGLGLMAEFYNPSRNRTVGFVLFGVGTITSFLTKWYFNISDDEISLTLVLGLMAIGFASGTLWLYWKKDLLMRQPALTLLGIGVVISISSIWI